jgi:hypothetical protein
MNPVIVQYFDTIEAYLLSAVTVVSYRIVRREISLSDGKLRVQAVFSDGSTAELFAYVAESEGRIELLKYSFHWQDAQGRLRRRWDNAPHYPGFPGAPHHVHEADGTVHGEPVPALLDVLHFIEHAL